MKAHVGDRLIIAGTHVGQHRRVGIVIEMPHPGGTPPYRVRWNDSGEESLVFPGPDAVLEQSEAGPA